MSSPWNRTGDPQASPWCVDRLAAFSIQGRSALPPVLGNPADDAGACDALHPRVSQVTSVRPSPRPGSRTSHGIVTRSALALYEELVMVGAKMPSGTVPQA